MRRLIGLVVVLLAVAAPSSAGFSAPHRVTPDTETVEALDQATDGQGDTTYLYSASDGYDLRIRKADGTLRPPVQVVDAGRVALSSLHAIAVDHDGDGIAVWDEEDPVVLHAQLFGRRFTAAGVLGPIVRISQSTPDDQSVVSVQAAVQPLGKAVVTWSLRVGGGYRPYLRLVGLGSGRGPVRQVGPGPNTSRAPLVLMKPSGRALLLWNNDAIMGRYLGAAGHLGTLHRIRGEQYSGEQPTVDDAALDARGIVVAACDRNTRTHATLPGDPAFYSQACVVRISRRLHVMGRLRVVSPRGRTIEGGSTLVGVAPRGQAVVTWLYDRPFDPADGTYARTVSRTGTFGHPRRLSYGNGGEIALTGNGDGVVTSTRVPADQFGTPVRIKVTHVRDGRLRHTVTVAAGTFQTRYLHASIRRDDRVLVSFARQGVLLAVSGR